MLEKIKRKLNIEKSKLLDKYLKYDLSFLIKPLSEKENWDENQTKKNIEDYKIFLFLNSFCNLQLTPSQEVDKVWRYHFTFESYSQTIMSLLGHPFNYYKPIEEYEPSILKSLKKTNKTILKRYINLNFESIVLC